MNLEKLDYWIACRLADINERLKEGVISDSFEYLIGAKNAYEAIRAQMTLVRYLEKE